MWELALHYGNVHQDWLGVRQHGHLINKHINKTVGFPNGKIKQRETEYATWRLETEEGIGSALLQYYKQQARAIRHFCCGKISVYQIWLFAV